MIHFQIYGGHMKTKVLVVVDGWTEAGRAIKACEKYGMECILVRERDSATRRVRSQEISGIITMLCIPFKSSKRPPERSLLGFYVVALALRWHKPYVICHKPITIEGLAKLLTSKEAMHHFRDVVKPPRGFRNHPQAFYQTTVMDKIVRDWDEAIRALIGLMDQGKPEV